MEKFLRETKKFLSAHFCIVSAEGTIILKGSWGMPPENILKNYTQMYAILVLSEITFEVIFV